MSEPTVPRLRRDLGLLPEYVAGKPPRTSSAVSPALGYKLSSNELPDRPHRMVVARASDALGNANRYPDIANTELVSRLAADLGVGTDRVVVGGGSIAVLQQIIQAVTNPRDSIVFAWRSYEAYPIIARVCHAEPVLVPLTDHRHDLPRMAEQVRATDAAMVIVCNPNNPTGTTVSRSELNRFLDEIPSGCLIVVDEAYREFVTAIDVPDALELVGDRANVVVLRTFSKAHGLAGLRVGYAVAPPPIAAAVRTVALPFTVGSVGQAAAVAALDNWPNQREVVADVTARRDQFLEALQNHGIDALVSQANFVWVTWSSYSKRLAARISEAGISVREFAGEGARITVGEEAAITALIKLLDEDPSAH